MIWKAVILLCLALGGQAIRIPISKVEVKKNVYAEERKELSHIGSHEPEHHEEYAWAYPSYEFSYSVNNPHTHDYKGQHEKRHGDEVTGEYWLLQPDGKKRTVKYQADKHKGFTAHVHYTDHLHHEEPHHEEIIKPVEESLIEEPIREAEIPDHIVVEEIEEDQNVESKPELEEYKEERKEEHEEKHQEKHVEYKPRGPTHIEYYVLHKYHHDEHEIKHVPKEEKQEEYHEPIKEHKPLPMEIISKIHHPIYNEHHGHVHEKHHHQIHYRPLINYNKYQSHKAPTHKAPLRITLINDEKEENNSEEISEVQAERKHHVERPAHIPLLHLYKPLVHNQQNHHYKEQHRRHYRSHGKRENTKQ
ncbi:hypothetical protein MSG28_007625 [Choristoneura fumiferana]|uniref:Uncharacterized protein n=1 Tax=Choristoneura fumiferana TaxID=7141 RepID=A0ACC0JXT8_CHOFU|nr:hypothetical protein MSG28_007625 [Choristoneura fumiferana]